MVTSVRTFNASTAGVVFNILFPDGASRTNTSVPETQWGQYGPNTKGVAPFAEWPTFNLSDGGAAAGNSSFLTWQGGLQYHDEAKGKVMGGVGMYDTYLSNFTGLTFGPVVLFDESAAASVGHGPGTRRALPAALFPTAIISPASHIHTGAMKVQSDPSDARGNGCRAGRGGRAACLWAHGPSGELTSVPAGYNHSTLLTFGKGIRPTLYGHGDFLLAAHARAYAEGSSSSSSSSSSAGAGAAGNGPLAAAPSRRRAAAPAAGGKVRDRSLEYLGYFTDNGAFYDAGYWPTFHGPKDASAVLKQLSESLAAQQVPVKYIQLDDWWYVGAKNDTIKTLVICTESFTPKNDTSDGGPGGPSLFQAGLKPLAAQFGGGLMLYMVNFCPKNPYLSPEHAVESFHDANGHYFLAPLPAEAEAAYGRLMDTGVSQGMNLFEIDFMERNFDFVPYYRTVAGAADGWLAGMNDAAESRGLATQLCSDVPRNVIASASMPAVTQFRASEDFACGLGGEPYTGNWDIGGQAMLINSFGLGASKDVFFTQGNQSGINHGMAGNLSVNDHHAELDVFLATLSSGPVGFGDGLGDTNVTLLMRCCSDDGKILRPSVAVTPIDATWTQTSRQTPSIAKVASATVWTAHTALNGSYWHFVVAIDVPTSFQLLGTDMWPAVSSGGSGVGSGSGVLHRRWHAKQCTHGMKAADCGVHGGLPDVATGMPAKGAPIGTHNWELTLITPLLGGGGGGGGGDGAVALLGELGKVTSVSSARFVSVVEIRSGAGGLAVTVAGTLGEKVEVAFVVGGASGTIVMKEVVIGESGLASMTVLSSE